MAEQATASPSSGTSSTEQSRPTLPHSNSRGGSYLLDHQQYRPPQASANIDDLLESSSFPPLHPEAALSADHPPPPSHPAKVHSIPPETRLRSPSSPYKVIDSGITHTLSHTTCQPAPNTPPNLVATIFYKSATARPPALHPDASLPIRPQHLPSTPPPAPGSAPTTDIAMYPLEPPPPGPEPLDHLYGQYVSAMCLAHFLQLLDGLQKPYAPIISSHRCLDRASTPHVVEVVFGPAPSLLSLSDLRRHEAIWRFEQEWNVEVVLQADDVWRRAKRLVVFDMDSTLIQQETIDELARAAGPEIQAQVKDVTQRAMNGELDFEASLRARVNLLRGVPVAVVDEFCRNMIITPGARELCRALKRLGLKMAVLSGGFMQTANYLASELGIEYGRANILARIPASQLEELDNESTVSGSSGERRASAEAVYLRSRSYSSSSRDRSSLVLSGELANTQIIDANYKAVVLRELAEKEGCLLSQVLAVGDGANDLLMLRAAGLGVAVNAKPRVQLEAPSRLNLGSLEGLLYLFGFTRGEIEQLLE